MGQQETDSCCVICFDRFNEVSFPCCLQKVCFVCFDVLQSRHDCPFCRTTNDRKSSSDVEVPSVVQEHHLMTPSRSSDGNDNRYYAFDEGLNRPDYFSQSYPPSAHLDFPFRDNFHSRMEKKRQKRMEKLWLRENHNLFNRQLNLARHNSLYLK